MRTLTRHRPVPHSAAPLAALPSLLALCLVGACAHSAPTGPAALTVKPTTAPACSPAQALIARDADGRAAPSSIELHLAKNFGDHRVAWLMRDDLFQKYVVTPHARHFGRCDADGCFLFVAPLPILRAALDAARRPEGHDAQALARALGLVVKSFEGPLRLMTLDVAAAPVCVRLPVESDPGVWKCSGPDDHDCFHFGGYTSGGVPEAMVVNAPVERTTVELIP